MGIPPAELLFRRKPCSHPNLLQPDIASLVRQRQTDQKNQRDCHCHSCNFTVGQPIWIKSLPIGGSWLPGTIVGVQSQEHFTACLRDGRTLDNHVDHIRPRLETPRDSPAQGPVISVTELLKDQDSPPQPTCHSC